MEIYMKKQVLIIGGGEVFKKYSDYLGYLREYEINSLENTDFQDWKRKLGEDLGEKFEVIYPKMPCKVNAKFLEWKIWLEKYFPFLKKDIVLIGHSLGAAFLLKYLAKNKFPVPVSQLHLVAAPIGIKGDYLGSFKPPKNLANVEKAAKKIFLYHSKDDPIVPFSNFEELSIRLPSAKKFVFQNYGHFIIEKFPEILEMMSNR